MPLCVDGEGGPADVPSLGMEARARQALSDYVSLNLSTQPCAALPGPSHVRKWAFAG